MKRYIKASNENIELGPYARKLASALKDNIDADISYSLKNKLHPQFSGQLTSNKENIQILANFAGDMMKFDVPVSDLTFNLDNDLGYIEDEVLEYIEENYGDEEDY